MKNKKVTTINVGGDPFAITMSPDGRKAYVFSFIQLILLWPGWVSVIDVLTHSVTNTIPSLAMGPRVAAVLPSGAKLYVTDCGDIPGVTIINTSSNTVVNTIPFGSMLHAAGIAPLPDGSKVYVTDWIRISVARIDTVTETVDMTMTVGRLPVAV